MSLPSLQYIRISNPSSSYNFSNAVGFRLCSTNKTVSFTIRSSAEPDGTLRRPSIATPPVRPSSNVPQPMSTPPPSPPPPAKTTAAENVVTMEFQRQRAKELQQYFKDKKIDEAANKGPFFGFVAKNEISNGRWAMFGFAVGMLTEYATGSDFVDQVKILLSNFGIVDLE